MGIGPELFDTTQQSSRSNISSSQTMKFSTSALPRFAASLVMTMTLSGFPEPLEAFAPRIVHEPCSVPMSGSGDRDHRDGVTISPSYRRSRRSGNSLRTVPPSQRMSNENDDSIDNSNNNLLCTIGIVSDIQYAPIPDGHSHSGTPRYYRHALDVARHAARHFEHVQADAMINLGDIIDGKCLKSHHGYDAVDDVIDALSVYTRGDILHIYGNHCLYNMNRRHIQAKLGIPVRVEEPTGELVGYYSQLVPTSSTTGNIRLVVLDSYDVTLLQRDESSYKRAQAERILRQHNGVNVRNGNENSSEGLVGLDKRFVAYNGGVGRVQLAWLEQQLQHARVQHERVVILSHQPILPGSASPNCLVWNYDDVLDVLRQYNDVVVASFAGHAHKGGYRCDDESGIHFRVVEAVLESPHPTNTYAILRIYNDRLEVQGFGDCQSAVYWCNQQRQQQEQHVKQPAQPQLQMQQRPRVGTVRDNWSDMPATPCPC